MLHICLTYDYELFMGSNTGTYDEILFGPSYKLAEAMSKSGVYGTFFVDVCSAMAFEKAGLNEFPDKFKKQVRELLLMGHDIQLHIHTSWLKAKKEGQELLLSHEGYKIHEFGTDRNSEISIYSIISDTKKYLEDICREVKPDYKCVAYRAGGFGIQPEKQLFEALREQGIVLDSSVVPHISCLGGVNSFDFTHVPDKLNWWINPDTGVSKAAQRTEKSIFEIPLATARPRLIECAFKKRSQLGLPPSEPKGTYVSFPNQNLKKPNKIVSLYHRLFDYRYVSLDSRNYQAVISDMEYIYKKNRLAEKDSYICLICHPKIANQPRIENIDNLINSLKGKESKFDFVTFSDIKKDVLA